MELFVGNNPVQSSGKKIKGEFVTIDGEKYYRIAGYDAMQPFFISIASESDLWMYLSSSGGVTAGRVSPDFALFPYYTDDKITESSEWTGSKTILRVGKAGKSYLWEPFSSRNKGAYNIERSIAKSTIGNKIRFTEKNNDLGLTFTYVYMNADRFGWIKKSILTNDAIGAVEVEIVDGLQNILPAGTNRLTQTLIRRWSMPTSALSWSKKPTWPCSAWSPLWWTVPNRASRCASTPYGTTASTKSTSCCRRPSSTPSVSVAKSKPKPNRKAFAERFWP
ncbi:MAG: hypothetical protein J6Y77_07215, partial [Paludibacteraceae bacterium]|nr:hypothetical protein [Paludibacteraceae bacterium]